MTIRLPSVFVNKLIDTDSLNTTTHDKFSSWIRRASKLNSLPRNSWRRGDGREKLVQRSTHPLVKCLCLPQSYRSVVDDHPKGYPQLAALLNSDENFLMCRRFGFLHSRVLLYRQDELYQLEKRLLALDEADNEESPLMLQSRQADNEQDDQQMRKLLIGKIDEKLKEYGTHLPNANLKTCLMNRFR